MAAIGFRNKYLGTTLSTVCIGDDVDKNIFRYVLAMDVDETFMFRSIEYKTQDFEDLTIVKELKRFIKINKFDLVLTRKSTVHNNTGCVGPALATLLGWHQLYLCM